MILLRKTNLVYMPKGGKSLKEGEINEIKQRGFSKVQYLMGLHGG